MTTFANLTPAEDERLTMLAEEAAEVIQAVCKIKRHGFESINPDAPEKGSNRKQLGVEIGNLGKMINFCGLNEDFEGLHYDEGYISKRDNLKKYTHHQGLNDNAG